jgi:nucleotide-binding universal stress UspA family protein
MKVVVATDGSEAALDAAHRAVALLRPDAQVAVMMVIPEKEDPMTDAGGIEGPALTEEQAEKDWSEATTEGKDALARTVTAMGTEVETRLVPAEEEPGHAIVRVATELEADLLVVGSGGKGFFKRLFTGSVSDYVVHHAPCPVLVIRHDH